MHAAETNDADFCASNGNGRWMNADCHDQLDVRLVERDLVDYVDPDSNRSLLKDETPVNSLILNDCAVCQSRPSQSIARRDDVGRTVKSPNDTWKMKTTQGGGVQPIWPLPRLDFRASLVFSFSSGICALRVQYSERFIKHGELTDRTLFQVPKDQDPIFQRTSRLCIVQLIHTAYMSSVLPHSYWGR